MPRWSPASPATCAECRSDSGSHGAGSHGAGSHGAGSHGAAARTTRRFAGRCRGARELYGEAGAQHLAPRGDEHAAHQADQLGGHQHAQFRTGVGAPVCRQVLALGVGIDRYLGDLASAGRPDVVDGHGAAAAPQQRRCLVGDLDVHAPRVRHRGSAGGRGRYRPLGADAWVGRCNSMTGEPSTGGPSTGGPSTSGPSTSGPGLTGARRVLEPVAAGVVLALAMPPWGWWPLAFLAFALLDRQLVRRPPAPAPVLDRGLVRRGMAVPRHVLDDRAHRARLRGAGRDLQRPVRARHLGRAHRSRALDRPAGGVRPRRGPPLAMALRRCPPSPPSR